jgi:hypothetical protein
MSKEPTGGPAALFVGTSYNAGAPWTQADWNAESKAISAALIFSRKRSP